MAQLAVLYFLNSNATTIKSEFGWKTCSIGGFKIPGSQMIKFKENLLRSICSGICTFLGIAQIM
jgi:hypothetical protein